MDDEITEQGGSPHEASLEPTIKDVRIWVSSVKTHFPKDRNCEICKGQKLQGHHAENAMAEPYLVLKILVT